jgi:large subunit ribosomal protein L6
MSRIGKKPITIPKGVAVTIKETLVQVKGPLGTLTRKVDPIITVAVQGEEIICTRANEERNTRAKHGLYRALIQNMVTGVSTGWSRTLQVGGVGYKAEQIGRAVSLAVGYSHPVYLFPPPGVTIEVQAVPRFYLSGNAECTSLIQIKGADREVVGLTTARIRKVRPVEPYKGKGIREVNEKVMHKESKAPGK